MPAIIHYSSRDRERLDAIYRELRWSPDGVVAALEEADPFFLVWVDCAYRLDKFIRDLDDNENLRDAIRLSPNLEAELDVIITLAEFDMDAIEGMRQWRDGVRLSEIQA